MNNLIWTLANLAKTSKNKWNEDVQDVIRKAIFGYNDDMIDGFTLIETASNEESITFSLKIRCPEELR